MTAMRMQFFTVALIILIGIGLTGFATAHWFLYVPVALLIFAGITGICPGHLFWKTMADFRGPDFRGQFTYLCTNPQTSGDSLPICAQIRRRSTCLSTTTLKEISSSKLPPNIFTDK